MGVARFIEIIVRHCRDHCSVPDCHNDSVKNPDGSFHRIPKEDTEDMDPQDRSKELTSQRLRVQIEVLHR